MSTKSRQTIHGGRIIGAEIRAQGARKAAQKAIREADRAEAEAWSIQMEGYGGPAQPSPTIAQCVNGAACFGYEISGSEPWQETARRRHLPDEIWLRCVRENEKAWRWYEREGFVLEMEQVEPMTGFGMKYYRWKKQGAAR
jgi:hypothetical protein